MATAHEHFIIREAALAIAVVRIEDDFGDSVPVSEIQLDRIVAADWQSVHPAWRLHPSRRHLGITLNWLQQRNRRRDKLDVAIRCGDMLCGLFLARLSRRRIAVTLRFLESNPFPHPLQDRMIPLGIIIAESFAEAYGAREVMISQPDRGLVSAYRREGYELTAADRSRERRGCRIRAKVLIRRL